MKELIDYLAGNLGIKSKILLEKDIFLHRILLRFSASDLGKQYIFKGGTCLIKCYLGYYRFSEDLDFTYKDQATVTGHSQKELRKQLSRKIDSLSEELAKIAKEVGCAFQPNKADNRYVEFGGSNKMVTFKLWYVSVVTKTEQFIKIQINFVEKVFLAIRMRKARTVWYGINDKELRLLFPGQEDLLKGIHVDCYDIREILIEKIRAILTRKGIKSRDFIDVYLIAKAEKIDVEKLEEKILDKTRFVLQYDKYVQNLDAFDIRGFILGEEEQLLLRPLDDGFVRFIPEFIKYLNNLQKQLKQK
jgi:predicted nucleotidyltransferase component of viral defense system